VTNRPLVSVITPTLNQAAFIERTLASVQAQVYPRIEHIVMDGGSTDGTLEIVRREADAGRLTYVSEGDRGMYDAVNKGLALARGDVLCYLNSDDAWFPWAVETVVATFLGHPDADIVFGDGIKVTDDPTQQRLRLFGPFDRLSLATYESLCQPAVFWHRRLYDRLGGFDPTMRFAADLDYWLRAAAAGAPIVHVAEVVAIERIHAARLSSAHEAAMATEASAMRARHAGDQGGPEARRRAVNRDERLQRWLWLRFMTAVAIRPAGRPWRQFIRHAGLSVRGRQIISGIRRYHHKRLWGAVTSTVAPEILGVAMTAPPRPSPVRGALQRLRLLAFSLPLFVPAWLAVRLKERRG
jgi:glycosyltransferase involved in cell wall biosynthesis